MATPSRPLRTVSATVPSNADLYVPHERLRVSAHEETVWSAMRLSISKPGAIWCTVCKTWYKYHAGSMPSLVRHCLKFHGAMRSVPNRQPPSGSSGPIASGGQSVSPSVTPMKAASMKPTPAAIPPHSHTPPGPSITQPAKPISGPPPAGAPLNAPVARSTLPPTATQNEAPKTTTGATSIAVPPVMRAKAAPPTSPNAVSTAASAATSTPAPLDEKPAQSIPVASKGVAKRRSTDRVVKVIAIPPAVRKVAEQCQTLLFDSTGMTFFNVKFQVPRSKEEALSVIRGGIRDMEKQETVQKLYFLGWAHSQFFSAEMAALGYRFSTAGIRCDKKMTKPPPVEEWLTLELPIRVRTRSRGKAPQAAAAAKTPERTVEQKTSPVKVQTAEQKAIVQGAPGAGDATKSAAGKAQSPAQAAAAAAVQMAEKTTEMRNAQGDTVMSLRTPQRPKGRIIDTIDLT